MKIKHSVKVEDTELDAIRAIVSEPIATVFPTAEEQAVAMEAAKVLLRDYINDLVRKAFNVGEKIGAYGSDVKDDAMYGIK